MSETELRHIFPIPILQYQWPISEQLNANLSKIILHKKASSDGMRATNIGGWHSSRDLQTWNDLSVFQIFRRIESIRDEMIRHVAPNSAPEHFERWNTECWANVSETGHRNRAHNHLGAEITWSGYYVVDVGGVGSASTFLQNRAHTPKAIVEGKKPKGDEVEIRPVPGLMVIFPSSLWHRVEVHEGEGSRITIAFNCKQRPPLFMIPEWDDS